MQIERVADIPHGALAYVSKPTGTAPVVFVDSSLTEAQVATLIHRLSSDPDLHGMLGKDSV